MEQDTQALLPLELLVMLVQITTRLGMVLIPELAMVKVESEELAESAVWAELAELAELAESAE